MAHPLVVNKYAAPYDVYVGRGSKWGNPYGTPARNANGTRARWIVSTREDAITKYEAWLLDQPELVAALPELRGKTLGCFCAPKPCHGDVLARLANG